MNTQEFIEKFVTIDFVESSGCYGHFPFQMLVEMADGTIELYALTISEVAPCYRFFGSKVVKQPKAIFMALDFPAGGDMQNDFVAVFSWGNPAGLEVPENTAVDVVAVPYNPETGEKKEVIKTSQRLSAIKSQLVAFASLYGQMI